MEAVPASSTRAMREAKARWAMDLDMSVNRKGLIFEAAEYGEGHVRPKVLTVRRHSQSETYCRRGWQHTDSAILHVSRRGENEGGCMRGFIASMALLLAGTALAANEPPVLPVGSSLPAFS